MCNGEYTIPNFYNSHSGMFESLHFMSILRDFMVAKFSSMIRLIGYAPHLISDYLVNVPALIIIHWLATRNCEQARLLCKGVPLWWSCMVCYS